MILVTGANGFVGSHLVRRLVNDGADVVILVRNLNRARGQLGSLLDQVRVVSGDTTDPDSIDKAMKGVTRVIHLAAIGTPAQDFSLAQELIDVNIGGTANILTAAVRHSVHRIVHASSAAVYGVSSESIKCESLVPAPSTVYGVSKFASEQICDIFASQHQLNTVSLRFFNIYGPGQDPHGSSPLVVPRFIRMLRCGESVTLYDEGKQQRDFVFVADCVQALVNATTIDGVPSGAYNIGSGRPTAIADLLHIAARELRVKPRVSFQAARRGDVSAAIANIRKAEEGIAFTPQTSLDKGISLTCLAAPH